MSAGHPVGQKPEPPGSFLGTVRQALLDPAGFFGSMPLSGQLRKPVLFAVTCLTVSTLLGFAAGEIFFGEGAGTSLPGWMLPEDSVALAALLVVLAPVGALVSLYFRSAIVHLLVMVFAGEGNRGFDATLRVFSYASAVALLSWIPLVGIAASIYGLYVLFVGLRAVHGGKSAAGVSER